MADAARWQTSNQAYGAFYKLPPRAKARDPQHTLLVALAPVIEPPSRERADQAAAAPQGLVLRARVVPQPGDGSCLFHSLVDGSTAEPQRLRHAIADFIEKQPDTPIGGEPLREWVRWDSCLPPAAYAAWMRGADSWGGAIEIAVRCAGPNARPHACMPRTPPPARCNTTTTQVILGGMQTLNLSLLPKQPTWAWA